MYKTLAISVFIFCGLSDQLHKYYMLEHYNIIEKGEVAVTSFFNLVMVWNRGVSFGMFQNFENSNAIFMVFSSAVILLLLYLALKTKDKVESILFATIAGGALGNVIDRVLHGAVADFFDFHITEKHWPAFNIADAYISCSAVILIVYTIFFQRKPETDDAKI